MPQTGQEVTTNKMSGKLSEAGCKCVCLNARSMVNKKNKLNSVEDTDPHIIHGPTKTYQMLN